MPSAEEIANAQKVLNDAAAEAAAKTAAAGAQTTTTRTRNDDDDDNSNFTFKDLQHESKKHRLKAAQYKETVDEQAEELARIKQENALLKAAENARQEKVLLEQGNAVEALKAEKESGRAKVSALQQKALDNALDAAMLKRGIDERLVKLVDRNGIVIDDEGTITGIDRVLDRFEESNADLIDTFKKGKSGSADPTHEEQINVQTKKPGPFDIHPTTGMTYEQLAKQNSFNNTGKTPAGGGQTETKTFNARTATKAETEAWYADLKRKAKK